MSKKPLITIITSTFNAKDKVKVTIESISRCKSEGVEWIVIDGDSNDGTVKLLESNANIIDCLVSEPDNGIYDAWNKGLRMARGQFLMFLGAGDFFDAESFKETINFIKNRGSFEKEIYLGTTRKYKNGKVTQNIEPRLKLDKLHYGLGYMHPGAIIPTEYYKKIGPFDTKYTIASDARSLILIETEIKPKRIQIPLIVYMDDEGVSSKNWVNASMQYLQILEELKLFNTKNIKKYKKHVYLRWFLVKKLKIKNFTKKIRHDSRNILVGIVNFILSWPFFVVRSTVLRIASAKIHSSTAIHRRVRVLSPWKLTIGKSTTINRESLLDARGGLEVGANTMIGHQVSIYTLGHDIQSPLFVAKGDSVRIGNNVVIFPHAIIQPGVQIADGAVVLPGSVVTNDIEKYSIVGGVPAIVKGKRNRNQLYQLDYKQWLAL